MRNIFLAVLVAFIATACNNNRNKSTYTLKQISWIVGDWTMSINGYTFHETWEQTSDTVLAGKGILLDSIGNKVFNEELFITLHNDTLWYQPTVSNQNDQKQISFKVTHLAKDSVVFENPQHDFPQVITYVKTSDTSIHAFVSGYSKGEPRKDDFFFVKKK